MKSYLGLLTTAILGGVFSIFIWTTFAGSNQNLNKSNTEIETNGHVISTGLMNKSASSYVDLSIAAEQTVQEVVHVKVTQLGQEMVQYNPMEFFFNGNAKGRKFKSPDKRGSGSGVVIREDGYIVTNNHVVAGADQIEVVFNNNESYQAKVVGTDPSTDLALLKIEATDLKAIPIGNSDDLKLGEWVLAVGNPYNLNSTVTAGIISAKARSIHLLQNTNGTPPLEAFIQTDAAVNPGNSGGALVNARGELIGINSAISSPTGSYSGYSFAIPVNIMKKVVNDIMEYGVVQRAFIGVSISDINAKLADAEDLKVMEGVYVADLSSNGAAQKAGIHKGDVVTDVNGVEVKSVAELQAQIGMYNPGDMITVSVNRKGKLKTFNMELRNMEGNTEMVRKPITHELQLGAVLKEVNDSEFSEIKIKSGVQVHELRKGKLWKSGMKNGFVITHVDNVAVKDMAQFTQIMKKKKGGVLLSGVYPNGVKKHYGIGM